MKWQSRVSSSSTQIPKIWEEKKTFWESQLLYDSYWFASKSRLPREVVCFYLFPLASWKTYTNYGNLLLMYRTEIGIHVPE